MMMMTMTMIQTPMLLGNRPKTPMIQTLKDEHGNVTVTLSRRQKVMRKVGFPKKSSLSAMICHLLYNIEDILVLITLEKPIYQG